MRRLIPRLPPVAARHWKNGVSYHTRMDEYIALDKQPLKITVELIEPYVPSERQSIHLDSLLSHAVANDVRAPATCVEGRVFPLPMELLWVSPDGYPLWACSDLKPESWHTEALSWWHKRISTAHLIEWSKNPNVVNLGTTKDYRVPMSKVITDKLVAYCVGNCDEIARLLSYESFIGKKSSCGNGRVTNWLVEPFECPDIMELIKTNRPMPLELVGGKPRGRMGAWTPPYWDRTRYRELF